MAVSASSWGEVRRYLTDDRDHGLDALAHERRHELVVFQGENGDWYVGVWPEGDRLGPSVRISTSGGAAAARPGLPGAVAEAYRAMGGETDDQQFARTANTTCTWCGEVMSFVAAAWHADEPYHPTCRRRRSR